MDKASNTGQRLRNAVNDARERLLAIGEEQSERQPAPGKWSPKEILGHLVDSASNNHQRFVRAQFQDHLIFPGYQQDAWVNVQHYRISKWTDLVELWALFNLHLAQVIDHVPDIIRNHPHEEHNLNHIAWKTVPEEEPATLEYFMADYVDHLEHHLRQIWEIIQSQEETGG